MAKSYVARHRPAIEVVPGPDRTILVGPQRRIRVDRHDSLFAAAVVADLFEIEDLPDGLETLRLGDALGVSIFICKPEEKPAAPNGWVQADAANGARIVYDPFDWPTAGDRLLPASPQVLLTLLRHANAYADEPAAGQT